MTNQYTTKNITQSARDWPAEITKSEIIALQYIHCFPKHIIPYIRTAAPPGNHRITIIDADIDIFGLLDKSPLANENRHAAGYTQKYSTYSALKDCKKALDHFSTSHEKNSSISVDRRVVKLFTRSFIKLRGSFKFRPTEENYISAIISRYLSTKIELLSESSLNDRSYFLASLIHVHEHGEQEKIIERIMQDINQADPKNSKTIRNLSTFAKYLNLVPSLASKLQSQNNAKCSLDTEKNNNKEANEECDLYHHIKRFVEENKDPKAARLMVAKYRRVSPRSLKEKTLDDWAHSYALHLVDHIVNSGHIEKSQKEFCHLLLTAQFFIGHSKNLEIYRRLSYTLRKSGRQYHLTYLSCAGLNPMLASIGEMRTEVFTVAPSRAFSNIADYFYAILKKRSVDKNIVFESKQADAVIVIATTDDARKTFLLETSLLSILFQTTPPKEVLIFIDPVHDDEQTISMLKDKLSGSFLINNHAWAVTNANKNARIKVIVNDRIRGQYYARNRGAMISECKYFFNQDDDDIACVSRVEEQIQAISNGSLVNYGLHVRIANDLSILQDSRSLGFYGDGIATLATTTKLILANPFLEVRSRADVEFRDRIEKRYGADAISRIDRVLMIMRGSQDTVSAKYEYRHPESFNSFYSTIAEGFFGPE